jgi:hypothetical protein
MSTDSSLIYIICLSANWNYTNDDIFFQYLPRAGRLLLLGYSPRVDVSKGRLWHVCPWCLHIPGYKVSYSMRNQREHLMIFSVANSWPNFSATSTKILGHWQKNSAPNKIFSKMLLFMSYTVGSISIAAGRFLPKKNIFLVFLSSLSTVGYLKKIHSVT